ncbi:glycosyltransferase [Microbacterium sp.]|jgi:glycosyltransferase involved in cell wall biosynthesis|uniref:glycosyltransferase n=1 Tax=Microbacterium sp. TaxID=51671 RepID=UPI0037C7486C
MKIIHATETLVGGVLAAVAALANKQADLGQDVTVVYSRKPTVPNDAELVTRFRPDVRRVEVAYRGRAATIPDLARALQTHTRGGVDVVHLHSTFAGLAGRLSPAVRRRAGVIAYSPHGWAFLRGESSAMSNRAALLMERLLKPRCDGLVLVSDSEAEVARDRLGAEKCAVLRNGIPVDHLPRADGSGTDRPVVVSSGRLMRQKAPDRFAEIARSLGDRAEFVWIGDGSAEEREQWIGDAPVRITGWLAHHDVVAQLRASDVFLFPTRWEGMPISLMEAQAMGLPSVATDIVGNRDVIVDGETGMLCQDIPELVAAVGLLIGDRVAREKMRDRAHEVQRTRLSDADLGVASLELYARLAEKSPAPAPAAG